MSSARRVSLTGSGHSEFLAVTAGPNCPGAISHVVGRSEMSLQLQLNNTVTNIYTVFLKKQLPKQLQYSEILVWRNDSNLSSEPLTSDLFKNRLTYTIKNFTLLIKAAQQEDSGCYCLEVTEHSGHLWKTKFNVSVFDPVEKPRLQGQGRGLDRGRCQVSLSCVVSRNDNVTYAWYRGTELIQKAQNLTNLKEEIDANGMYIYACNVSNPISWEQQTLNLTQDCQNAHREFRFWPFLVTIVILVTLLLGALTCFYMWRRKRKQSQTSPKESLTVYEDIKDLKTRNNQEREQNPPGEGSTIYSVIQSQSPVSTSRETSNTLYAFIQPSGKSGSKQKHHSPSFACTIYEEVGNTRSKAQNPTGLSRKELESFYVYS
ncbi:natural killer cell receptor 2B4 [Carlito syrichta]|uniref:Natural killer cell receptor 2B4 n=1 Tax=Carlito syrichta TaxID=1868482 RepID=A0A1U7TTA2_CARSF|nr:natural killer cell receptor 2B4 [Carlito syrichta]